ncbi:MAG: hypothetical protein HKM93_12280 [Desulfobacteraceae bacterium]|nr:hypothetical protein [Desulfobacteraceae bacterium]
MLFSGGHSAVDVKSALGQYLQVGRAHLDVFIRCESDHAGFGIGPVYGFPGADVSGGPVDQDHLDLFAGFQVIGVATP